jgi:hypothetical protein
MQIRKFPRVPSLLLVWALLALAISPASASSAMFPLTPSHLDQDGFVFNIQSEHVHDNNVRFHVVITAQDGHLPDSGSGYVGFVDLSHGWSVMPGFNLDLKDGKRDGTSIRFDFTVPAGLLVSPRLFFVFGYDPVPKMPAINLYYARLKDFSQP